MQRSSFHRIKSSRRRAMSENSVIPVLNMRESVLCLLEDNSLSEMLVSANAKHRQWQWKLGSVNGRNFEKLVLNSSLRGDVRNTKLILARGISVLSCM